MDVNLKNECVETSSEMFNNVIPETPDDADSDTLSQSKIVENDENIENEPSPLLFGDDIEQETIDLKLISNQNQNQQLVTFPIVCESEINATLHRNIDDAIARLSSHCIQSINCDFAKMSTDSLIAMHEDLNCRVDAALDDTKSSMYEYTIPSYDYNFISFLCC